MEGITQLQYHLVDVFTNEPFAGNQLAVFMDSEQITDELMQKLAGELSLSETTFVAPPANAENDFQVRIFTPKTEIGFAGHPTLGTAFVLAHEGMLELSGTEKKINFEEGIGVVPVTIEVNEGKPGVVKMKQELPRFGSNFSDRFSLAEMLSLDSGALHQKYPCQVVNCGIPFLFVPVRNLDMVRNIKFRLDVWSRLLRGSEACCVMPFTTETVNQDSSVHCRLFAPGLGVMEDAATGSANGPLGCYLVEHGVIPCDQAVTIISEQGFEMGRPSLITIEIEKSGDKISSVVVGGECVYVGSGHIRI
jgi:trans-2,3-dihydro-3-hydroxyanthranilate isomerase